MTDRMQQIAEDVRKFHDRATEFEARMDAIAELLWMSPECPIRQAAWGVIGGYIGGLDRAWNIGSWLKWWWQELNLGEKPGEAGLTGEEMRSIRTIEDLIQIIQDDLRASEGEK